MKYSLILLIIMLTVMLLLPTIKSDGGRFSSGTHFFESKKLNCLERTIVSNPCAHIHKKARESLEIKSYNYQNYKYIFLENGNFIDIPSLAALHITYKGENCSVVIMPENQVISSLTTLNYNGRILSYRDRIFSSSPDHTVWVNETTIYLPSNENTVTLYGFLQTDRLVNNGSVGWHNGNQGNQREIQWLNNEEYAKDGYVWAKITKPRRDLKNISKYFGFVYYYETVTVSFGVAYKVQEIDKEIDECDLAKKSDSNLCKKGAICHNLLYGYYCAWPSSSSSKEFPYQAPYAGFDPSWILPDNIANCESPTCTPNMCFQNSICGVKSKTIQCEVNNATETPTDSYCQQLEKRGYLCPEHYLKPDKNETMNDMDKLIEDKVNSTKDFEESLDKIIPKLEELLKHKSYNETKSTLSEILTKFDKVKKNEKANSVEIKEKVAFSIEKNALLLASAYVKETGAPEKFTFQSSDGEVQVEKFESPEVTFIPTGGSKVEEIKVKKGSNNATVGVVFQYINNTEVWVATKGNETKPNLVSSIITASLTDKNINITVEFRLKHSALNETSKRSCGYFEIRDHSRGDWKTDGCKVADNTSEISTLCECDHLTHFGILLDWNNTPSNAKLDKLLSIISIIGCIICIFFLILFLFVVLRVFSNEKKSFKFVYVSLSFCLLMGNLVFVIGIRLTGYKGLCGVIAGLIEYFFLAAFVWKLIYGSLACHSVLQTREFVISKRKKIIFCLCGFLVPAIVVAISAGVKPGDYGSENACWLKVGGVFYSFLGFVLFAIVANLVNIIIIFVVLLRSYLRSFKFHYKSKFHVLFMVQASLCMGFTWLSGFMMFDQTSKIIFSVLFSLANAMQGVMIFLTLVIVPKRSRNLLHGYVSSILTSSTSGGDSSKTGSSGTKSVNRYQKGSNTTNSTSKEMNTTVADKFSTQQQIHTNAPLKSNNPIIPPDDKDNDDEEIEAAGPFLQSDEENKISVSVTECNNDEKKTIPTLEVSPGIDIIIPNGNRSSFHGSPTNEEENNFDNIIFHKVPRSHSTKQLATNSIDD